jgi:lipopolysaccharide/colanic/teichoic acid biosynthesis glycosyltransferase
MKASGTQEAEYTIRIDEDPRVTKVGAVLRRWSIDELPNLVNVLKGSMSLVGPRPIVREEAELIGLDNQRFTVKPGVTGLAQVHGRDTISLADRTEWDDVYVEIRSSRVDAKILLKTVGTVFSSSDDDVDVPGEE